jgi:hypothetical protein
MNEKVLRLDLVIALVAVLISTIAAVATVYQSRIIADQYSATVWPYLSVTYTLRPDRMDLVLRNDGLGPALIRSAQLRYNDRPVGSWNDFLHITESAIPKHVHGAMSMTAADVNSSSIVRSGDTLLLLTLHATGGAHFHVQALRRSMSVQVCYCSLLGRCWMTQRDEGAPRDIRACPAGQSISSGNFGAAF